MQTVRRTLLYRGSSLPSKHPPLRWWALLQPTHWSLWLMLRLQPGSSWWHKKLCMYISQWNQNNSNMTFILDKARAGDVAQLRDHLPSMHRLWGLCSVSIKPNRSHDDQTFNHLQLHIKLETSLYYMKHPFPRWKEKKKPWKNLLKKV